jgi:hypothetical protein
MKRTYATPLAFKDAVERRLRDEAFSKGREVNRLRQLLVFDRSLARAFKLDGGLVLKGGLALDLRVENARATRDVDLRAVGEPDGFLGTLQEAGRLNLNDFLRFDVQLDREAPTIEGDGVVYGGRRYRAQGMLAGRAYGAPFGVDVVFGGPVTGSIEVVEGKPFLRFADIDPAMLRILPVEQHIAEKLHALSLPRPGPNSRMRDLPDVLVLAGLRPIEAKLLTSAIRSTFDYRDTHPWTGDVPPLPATWAAPYSSVAAVLGLRWRTLDDAVAAARAFIQPLATGQPERWNPAAWGWDP